MKKNNSKKPNFLLIYNIILSAILLFTIFKVFAQQKEIDGAFESMRSLRDTKLETDLRNRGIIDGDLLLDKQKPYSLERMEEFKKYAESQK